MVRAVQEVADRGQKREGMTGSLRRWQVRAMAAALVVSGWTAVAGATSAAAAESPAAAEASFVQHINSARSAQGRAPLSSRGDLASVARNHAQRMLDRNDLFHNPNLGGEVNGWEIVAENVGTGISVDQVHRAFMGSSTHRNNILSSEVSEVGVGVVAGPDGSLWVVEVFRLPVGAAQSAPAPVAAPAPAPASAPTPAPAPAPVRPATPTSAPAPTTTVAPAPPTTAAAPPTTTTAPDRSEKRRVAAAALSRWALVDTSSTGSPLTAPASSPWTMVLWLTALLAASGGVGAVGIRRLVAA